MQIKPKTLSSAEFVRHIESIVKEKGIEYIDAVIHYCAINNIELETAGAMIRGSQFMKSNIQLEAENLNFLPKRARLPI